jgi:hypothetical protein
LASLKVTELKRKEIQRLTRVSIPAGPEGFAEFPFAIMEIKPQHIISFTINVLQNGRTDLDVGFSVMNDDNYHKWLARQPSSAFLIAHRFKYGTTSFMPSNVGLYHAVLDNRYSIFTRKEVEFSMYEMWLEEKEVSLPVPEKPKEEIRKPKLSLWQRILNRLRYSRTAQVIVLLVSVQMFCFLLAIGLAFLFYFTLGVEYKDTMGYIATAVGGSAVAVSVYLYFAITGRPPPALSPA